MKKDLVLTMNEYLDAYCIAPMHVKPPARDARHVPIALADDLESETEEHGCRCDRWGHPCPGCLKRTPPTRTAVSDFSPENEGGE